MFDFNLINEEINNTLKEENSEVVYSAWLSYFNNSKFEDTNIIVTVPNMYTKNIIEERYLCDIEDQYREKLSFKNIILNISEADTFNSTISNIVAKEDSTVLDDFVEKINFQIKNIYEFIETATNSGLHSISYILPLDWVLNEEVYLRLKELMFLKGFKTEFNTLDNKYTLNLSW